MSFYRVDGWVQTPLGLAVPGADVAVLDQPADFSSQPGTPLADIYAASSSNSANITAASWSAQQIEFTFDSVPDDVVPNAFFSVSGADPATFDSPSGDPYQVISILGDVVTVSAPTNPGTYVSGGTVATSVLPNPTTTDGNGHYFFYAAAGLVSIQIYGAQITELDYPDQGVGTVAGGSVTSVALTGDGVIFDASITGSPITSSGTLDLSASILDQDANTFLGGPTSGSAVTPSFRALVAADIPSLDYVESVALTVAVPAIFTESVTGSPITDTGTIAITIGLATQSANLVFAGPSSGAAAQPTFRSLVAADLPGAVLSVATLTLTSAQILALHGTPVQIVPAPSAGQVLLPVSAVMQYKYGSAAYANVTNAQIVISPAGLLGSTDEPIQVTAANFIDQTSNQLSLVSADGNGPQSDWNAAALVVANEGGSGEFTTGNGTIVVTLWYMTLTLS
jgi:hypothetical protein